MKNAMQLKAIIKNLAKEKHISAQLVMQNFMLERLLERIRFLLEDSSISVLAYNLETIMAEKLETVISRGDQNTRSRDYYDIYILTKLQYLNIEPNALKAALEATTEKRGSLEVVRDYRKIMDTVRNSGIIIKRILNIRKILCLWMHVIWLFS